MFTTYNINFDLSDSVYNILTTKVFPQKEAARFLNAKIICQKRYKSFVTEKVDGDGLI